MKKIKNGYSLIEYFLIAGIIIILFVSAILILLKGAGSADIGGEVKKINQALFMLSKKPFSMTNDESFNDKILSKAGFEFLEKGTAYTPSKYKGDFDNIISIVEFPSAGLKSVYTYSQYEALKEEYNSELMSKQYKMTSDCDSYEQTECEVFFKINIM